MRTLQDINTDIGSDSLIINAGSYIKKRPYLTNRDYKFITDLTDSFNKKLSNGVMFYEILRMNGEGKAHDKIDQLEDLVNERVNNITDTTAKDIDTFYTITKDQAKTKLTKYYNNEYDGNDQKSRQRNVRLPEGYYERSEDLKGQMNDILKDSIHGYVQVDYRSRSHRIEVKRDLINYVQSSEDYAFDFDITAKIVNDLLDQDIEINNIHKYKKHGHNIDKWDKRFKALNKVVENDKHNCSHKVIIKILENTHDIKHDWAQRKYREFKDLYDIEDGYFDLTTKEYLESKGELEEVKNQYDTEDYCKDIKGIVSSCKNNMIKETRLAERLKSKYDHIDNFDLVIDILDEVKNGGYGVSEKMDEGQRYITI